jgi:sugar phosphate isomerase/epimerase
VLTGGQILWPGTIGLSRTPTEVVDAAVAAGVVEVSLSVEDAVRAGPRGRAELSRYATDRGVAVGVLDGLLSWMPLTSRRLAERASPLPAVLEAARDLGAGHLNAVVVKTDLDTDGLADSLAQACDAAAAAGCAVMLEFSPIGGLPDLAAAWDLVQRADRPNAGILFDTWHFFRGTPDIGLLATIPSDRIMAVQISDVGAEVQGDLWQDTLHHRRLPGDGAADLDAVARTLTEMGALTRVGPEVISDELHALRPGVAARRAVAAVDALFARASAPLSPRREEHV